MLPDGHPQRFAAAALHFVGRFSESAVRQKYMAVVKPKPASDSKLRKRLGAKPARHDWTDEEIQTLKRLCVRVGEGEQKAPSKSEWEAIAATVANGCNAETCRKK